MWPSSACNSFRETLVCAKSDSCALLSLEFHWPARRCLCVINTRRYGVSLYSVSSTDKVVLLASSRTTLFPIPSNVYSLVVLQQHVDLPKLHSESGKSLEQWSAWICVRFFTSCGNRIMKLVCRGSRKQFAMYIVSLLFCLPRVYYASTLFCLPRSKHPTATGSYLCGVQC